MPLVINAQEILELKDRLENGQRVDSSKEKEVCSIHESHSFFDGRSLLETIIYSFPFVQRQLLHQKSIEHVKHWQNTIVGQRRNRLKEREHRLKAEEAERVRIDEDHAHDEQERRRAFINRAKNLVFYEQDKVKKIHSNILLDLVLEVWFVAWALV